MKVRKYQEGGQQLFTLYQRQTPWITQTETGATQSQAAPASVSGGKESSLDKFTNSSLTEAVKTVISHGLPNEASVFMNALAMYQLNPNSPIAARKIIAIASNIKYSDTELKKAEDKMYANGAGSEIARSGLNVYVRNTKTNEISIKNPTKLDKNDAVLTYSQLATARANDKQLSFNSNVIGDIGQGIGMEKIDDFIVGIIDKLGQETIKSSGVIDKASLKKTIDAYAQAGKKPTSSELEQLTELVQAGVDGIYNITKEHTTNRNYLPQAFNYLYRMLPQNMKDALMVKGAIENIDPAELIKERMLINTSSSETTKLDFNASATKEATGGSKSGTKTVNLTPLEKLIFGDLNADTPYRLRDHRDRSIEMVFPSSANGTLVDYNNNPIDETILSDILHSSKFGAFVDRNNVYFGEQKLNQGQLDYVIYNDSPAYKIKMPVTRSGGIDWEKLKALGMAHEEVSQLENKTPEVIQTIYSKYGLPVAVDADLKIHDLYETGNFIVITGESTEHIVDETTPYVEELFGMDQDIRKNHDYQIWDNLGLGDADGWIGLGRSDIVRAPIFMKLLPSAQLDAAYAAGHGSTVTNPTLEQDMANELIRKRGQQNPFGNANLNISALNQ